MEKRVSRSEEKRPILSSTTILLTKSRQTHLLSSKIHNKTKLRAKKLKIITQKKQKQFLNEDRKYFFDAVSRD